MRIVKPSAEVMKHDLHPYEFIEKVGRTCYKSEDSITEGSAERFVGSLVKREHMAMLEHEHLYYVLSDKLMNEFLYDMDSVNERLEFFKITHEETYNILSGSFRSFYDLFKKGYNFKSVNIIKESLQLNFPLVFGQTNSNTPWDAGDSIVWYSRETFIDRLSHRPDILFKHLVHTFKFVTDRGVTHEFVRHRPASFAQESTRYCNYCKDKFGNEITVIEPCFWGVGSTIELYKTWFDQCFEAEKSYFKLIDLGATPQQARTVLPNSLKTELIITATESEWQHIVNLRYLGTTGAPHPQIKEVMGLALADIIIESKGRITADGRK